jgi:PTS system mannose-specific IIA component
MVGAVIVTHHFIGKELIGAAEYLLEKMEGIIAVSIDANMNLFEIRKTLSDTIKKVDQGETTLIMTDVFGTIPSKIASSLLNDEKIEVITGVNLPMILTFWRYRKGRTLKELAISLQLSGRRSIVRTKEIIKTKIPFERINSHHKTIGSSKIIKDTNW